MPNYYSFLFAFQTKNVTNKKYKLQHIIGRNESLGHGNIISTIKTSYEEAKAQVKKVRQQSNQNNKKQKNL